MRGHASPRKSRGYALYKVLVGKAAKAEIDKRMTDERARFAKEIERVKAALQERPRKLSGRIMFPTTHDITMTNVDMVLPYLQRWLAAGNEFLIVSKPNPQVIDILTNALHAYKDKITFRFTIGSTSRFTLSFWEPNAPTYEERMKALKMAFDRGYKTSVSCEPYLDENINLVVKSVLPYVTDTVWIGKMNKIALRVPDKDKPEVAMHIKAVQACQTDEKVRWLYELWKSEPKVKWKDSIKQVIGLPEEEIG